MKKVVLLSLATVGWLTLNAQNLSVGAKTGVSNCLSVENGRGAYIQQSSDCQKLSWDKELFVRNQAKWPLAIEVGVNHATREMEPISESWSCCFGPCIYDTFYTQATLNYTEINISLQYKLPEICKKSCLLSRMSNYIGIILTPGIITTSGTRYNGSTYLENPPAYTSAYNDNSKTLSYGLNHTLVYSITRRLSFISTAGVRMRSNQYYGHSYRATNVRANLSIGASYNIK